jgi:hypothetical protein
MLNISRLFLLQTILFLLGVELLMVFSISESRISRSVNISSGRRKYFKDVARIKYILPSAIWLIITFFTMEWLKVGRIYYYAQTEQILLILFGSWALSTFITWKYSYTKRQNIYYYITPYFKAGILMLLFVSIFFFFLRLEPLSRFLLFGTAIVHSGLEVIAFALIYLIKNVDVPGQGAAPSYKTNIVAEELVDIVNNDSVISKYSKTLPLQKIIKSMIPLKFDLLQKLFPSKIMNLEIEKSEISIMSTQTVFNIDIQDANIFQMIINMEKLNNLRRINQYFLSVYGKIKAGGWIVGTYIAIEDDRDRLRSKMPKLVFSILYPAYFLIHRVLPKTPYLKNLYFLYTKGRNRKLSRAEVLGRLAYCGYKIINEETQNTFSYFIAQKVRNPSDVQHPSYGLMIRLDRIGYHGECLSIYKFRTMHPYSEFIQKEVFEQNDLNESGKMENDFRVTKWGKLLRKTWIDELPQLLNWFRGDVAIVGVRALSEQYFSLYPASLQKLRTQFKPGLIPPYYADLPGSFEEILESERNYLLKKQKHHLRTDFSYFGKALYNIIIKGARSS